MDTTKAHQRLKQAQHAVRMLEQCHDFSTFEASWLDFLLHANGVYAQLEQAAKESPQARQWFGAKKQQRKRDDLLQYLHQARHADEHTLQKVSRLRPGEIIVGKTLPGHGTNIKIDDSLETGIRIESLDKKPIAMEIKGPTIELRPVTGRGGETYNPPEIHKGKPLTDKTPVTIAIMATQYLSELLEEADKLA